MSERADDLPTREVNRIAGAFVGFDLAGIVVATEGREHITVEQSRAIRQALEIAESGVLLALAPLVEGATA